MIILVILFTERKSKYEKEIIEILEKYGANHFSDKSISDNGGSFTVISIYKPTSLSIKNAIAVFLEANEKFIFQVYPIGIIGICEDTNIPALENFKQNHNAVITCGICNKNTLTISSFGEKYVLVTLQRAIIDLKGNKIEPREYKISLTKPYSEYSILSATAILITKGIYPESF